MFNENAKKRFADLGMEYPPVAVKFHYARPEGVRQSDKTLSFCQFLKEAQTTGERFYIAGENDNCHGKMALGMAPKEPLAVSGQQGYDLGVYRTPAPNARLHASYPTLYPGSVNYVEFCPVSRCDFEPDLVVCVAEMKQADILMRATSYISGDLWESRSSCVLSCAWTYVYPYLSGKVNFCVTGLHHGLKRREVYPEGRMIISIPYQKLGEVCEALEEMPWELPALKKDPESQAWLRATTEHWKEISPD
ncbi:MAG: DUF169 domain-containing protein [Oscillospiraceae bacterium]